MFHKFTINNKLNLLLIVYALSVFLFQPLAITIQFAMIIFMFYRKEFRIALYGVSLFIIMTALFYYVALHKSIANDWFMITIVSVVVLVNLIWFMTLIKVLKYNFYNSSLISEEK